MPDEPKPAPQGPRGVVIIAIGLPGSGKSTWFEKRHILPLSTDLLRKLLLDDETDQSQQQQVFGALYGLLRRRLAIGRRITYVDATNLHSSERRTFFKIAEQYGYLVNALFFDVALDVCMERNRARSRIVPHEVMEAFARKLQPPQYAEGFHEIAVVNSAGEISLLPR